MHGCANAWAYLALHNCIVKHAQATTKTYIRDIQNKCIGILVWKLHSTPQMHGCVNVWAYQALHNCNVKHAQVSTKTYIRDIQNKCIGWDPCMAYQKLHSIPQMHWCVNAWAYLALHNCTVKHAQATTQTYICNAQRNALGFLNGQKVLHISQFIHLTYLIA